MAPDAPPQNSPDQSHEVATGATASQPEDAQPQEVLTPLTSAAMFLVLTMEEGGEKAVREVLTGVNDLRKSVSFRIPDGGLTCVVGVGSDAWDRLFEGPRPKDLHPFVELDGPHKAPSTPGDILLHIRAWRLDMCFELAQLITNRFGDAAKVVDEVHGFRSFDERDLLGFVDGTANPEGGAAVKAVEVGAEDPHFAGGSYVIVQKYVHDLKAWNSLTIEQQEQAFGRTKLDDVEIPDDLKKPNSHVALNTIVDDEGNEHDIMRFNMPFGNVGAQEFGTYYIGYAKDPGVTEEMLRNMFLGKPAGNTDRILDFSTALTGTLFFTPSASFLDDLPDAPASVSQDQPGAAVPPGVAVSAGVATEAADRGRASGAGSGT